MLHRSGLFRFLFYLWLLAGLATACSVDLHKLRAPARVDAAADATGGPIITDPIITATVDGDVPEVAPPGVVTTDVGALIEPTTPDATAGPAEVTADKAPDLAASDRPEETSGAGGTAGIIGSGVGGAGRGGASGSGGVGSGGVGSGGMGSGGMGSGGMIGSGGTPSGTGGVSGSGGTNQSGGNQGSGGAALDPDLVLWYRFDESSGARAADSAAGHNATLQVGGGTAAFSASAKVGSYALSLANGGFAELPTSPRYFPQDAITIAVWVYPHPNTSNRAWQRVLDLSRGTNNTAMQITLHMCESGASSTNCPVGFEISSPYQRLKAKSALSEGAWHHIAVVLPAAASAGSSYTGKLYVDGVEAASNAMTLHLKDVGAISNIWLGRSSYSSSSDYLNGLLDDFRVYSRALSQSEISDLVTIR